MYIFNPKRYDGYHPDQQSAELIQKTIGFFEQKGKQRITEDDSKRTWYRDFLDFQKGARLFAQFLTPASDGDGSTRWDTWRNCALNEVLGFMGWRIGTLGRFPYWGLVPSG